jgi:Sigma-70 factor, region 1.1
LLKEVAVMKEKDLKVALLELGRKKGVLTFEELNETFPAEYFPLAEMERFLCRLEHLGVRVVEGREHARNRSRRSRAA